MGITVSSYIRKKGKTGRNEKIKEKLWPREDNQMMRIGDLLIPERILTELLRLMGHPSLSQVIEGKGIPEASQVRDTEFFSTTLIFSGVPWFPMMLGGAARQSKTNRRWKGR